MGLTNEAYTEETVTLKTLVDKLVKEPLEPTKLAKVGLLKKENMFAYYYGTAFGPLMRGIPDDEADAIVSWVSDVRDFLARTDGTQIPTGGRRDQAKALLERLRL